MNGCQSSDDSSAAFHHRLPFSGKPYDLQVIDLNHDGLQDLVVVDHGENLAEIFFQLKSGDFQKSNQTLPVGYHPGHFWVEASGNRILQAAEGDGKIRSFSFSNDGQVEMESELTERFAEYLARFQWPGWQDALAVTPYHQNYVVLYKGYDPGKGDFAERFELPFSEKHPSVVEPERPEVLDLDQDGSDELIYVARISEQLIALKAPVSESEGPRREVLMHDERWGMPGEAHGADLNEDGFPDLVIGDETLPGMIRMLMNDGHGNLSEIPPLDPQGSEGISKLATAIDKDGARLLAVTEFDHLKLFRMEKGWQPGAPAPFRNLSWPRNRAGVLALKDLNGDGWLDLVTSVQNGKDALWVVYGPLWTHFEELEKDAHFDFSARKIEK